MIRKVIICLLTVALLSIVPFADAQQAAKVPRVGFLHLSTKTAVRVAEFREGLRELGYVEGQNITVEYRFAKGRRDRLTELAAELVDLKLNVIVASTTPSARALKRATTTIPIVMVVGSDPVARGLVASLQRPGGNMTGLTLLAQELSGKRLELLKKALPKVRRVGVLWDGRSETFREMQGTAQSLGLELRSLEARGISDLERVFEQAAIERTDAVVMLTGPLNRFRKRIPDLAVKSRLPLMAIWGFFVEAGGLMSYGPSQHDIGRRTAHYVDRILKGAKPADLPIERPIKFELVINLKTAKQLGLTIPPEVLFRADKVIK